MSDGERDAPTTAHTYRGLFNGGVLVQTQHLHLPLIVHFERDHLLLELLVLLLLLLGTVLLQHEGLQLFGNAIGTHVRLIAIAIHCAGC